MLSQATIDSLTELPIPNPSETAIIADLFEEFLSDLESHTCLVIDRGASSVIVIEAASENYWNHHLESFKDSLRSSDGWTVLVA